MTDSTCDVCGEPVSSGDLCDEHKIEPVLYHLDDTCGREYIEEGRVYSGVVNGVVDYGVFVSLNSSISGLVHESNMSEPLDVGDEVDVRISEIREDGDLNLSPVETDGYTEAYVGSDAESEDSEVEVETLEDRVGETVSVTGKVLQTKQTSGPTIFTLGDGTGTVECAAFVEAGVRAYPEVDTDDVVTTRGVVEERDGELQIEVSEMEKLEGEEEKEVRDSFEDDIDSRADPPEVEPLVESEHVSELWDDIRKVAKAVRRAVMTGRPIIVRHHADADGISSGAVVERAVFSLMDEVQDDPDAPYHLFRRMPSKAPFYEMEDVTRDLNYALQDTERHGHPTPILLMIDNGSTEEDTPAYEIARSYDVPIYIVDHHSPDDAVEEHVEEHVNPYLVGGDYSITSGMLCTELARLIEPGVEDDVRHVPAIAGKGDRSEADEMEEYVEIAEDEGYGENHAERVAKALDYEAFHLKYDDGRHLVNHILDIADNDVHADLVDKLADRADEAFERQMSAALPHVEEEELENGTSLYTLNVEKYTHKFTFPTPGRPRARYTTGRWRTTREPSSPWDTDPTSA
ncbi:MAG: OB-fold nucleic acid binding domain-containing protein [Halobacteria archaeon]|nr:OB-fold nucleic acid binding domain-containing protein [Halobacteria archaeon]